MHIYERYVDSAAAVSHVQRFVANFAERFLSLCTPTRMSVYGEPSDELKETIAGFNPRYSRPGRGPEVSRAEYADRIVRGGFPEAIARSSPRRRERFHDSYVADLVARDVMQLSDIERTVQMRALIRLLAARSGSFSSPAAWAMRPGYLRRRHCGTSACLRKCS